MEGGGPALSHMPFRPLIPAGDDKGLAADQRWYFSDEAPMRPSGTAAAGPERDSRDQIDLAGARRWFR